MPLNSMLQYVKKTINGITVPGQQQPLIAYVTPPVVDNMGGAPKAYVWTGTSDGSRQTMPRGPGFKQIKWNIDIYLNYETNPNRPPIDGIGIDNQFPLIIDAVLGQLWVTPMPLFVGPDGSSHGSTYQTGDTQVHFIGETWRLDYPPERTPATMRMLWYSALLTVDVTEVIQA